MSPPVRSLVAVAAGAGFVTGLILHLVQHASTLLGAGDPIGGAGVAAACAAGLVAVVLIGSTIAVPRRRRGVIEAAVAFGVGFAVSALIVGPWLTAQ